MEITHPSISRVVQQMTEFGLTGEIKFLSETARTAKEAADGLGIEVGQVASSIIFGLPNGDPILIITSGAHRVDTNLVCEKLEIASLSRVDANYVRAKSGFAIGGVSPIGWIGGRPKTIIDEALAQYETIWAAAGHPHAVFATTFQELKEATGATPMVVA